MSFAFESFVGFEADSGKRYRHPDLASDQAPAGFHNYLDEFRAYGLALLRS